MIELVRLYYGVVNIYTMYIVSIYSKVNRKKVNTD